MRDRGASSILATVEGAPKEASRQEGQRRRTQPQTSCAALKYVPQKFRGGRIDVERGCLDTRSHGHPVSVARWTLRTELSMGSALSVRARGVPHPPLFPVLDFQLLSRSNADVFVRGDPIFLTNVKIPLNRLIAQISLEFVSRRWKRHEDYRRAFLLVKNVSARIYSFYLIAFIVSLI